MMVFLPLLAVLPVKTHPTHVVVVVVVRLADTALATADESGTIKISSAWWWWN